MRGTTLYIGSYVSPTETYQSYLPHFWTMLGTGAGSRVANDGGLAAGQCRGDREGRTVRLSRMRTSAAPKFSTVRTPPWRRANVRSS